jgi:hypothetical protein
VTPSTRTRRTAALLGAAGILLAGCGGATSAGSAAVLGESRVTVQQVADDVAAVHRANDEPVNQTDDALTRSTVERLVTEDLVNQLADRNGITVPQGDVDAQLSAYDAQLGGRENVVKAFLENGVPPEAVEGTVTLSLQAEALGRVLAPQGTPEEQSKAVYDAVVALSDELDVTVSPRFGTWDPTGIAVLPPPTDLAVPAADAEGADALPQESGAPAPQSP